MIFTLIILASAASLPSSTDLAEVELTCLLLDSISGSWSSEYYSIVERTFDLPVDIPQSRLSLCGQGHIGIDIRFEDITESLRLRFRQSDRFSIIKFMLDAIHSSNLESENWRILILLDSTLVVWRESLEPEKIQLDGDPGYFSLSPEGRFALIYHIPGYDQVEGMLTRVNLIKKSLSSVRTASTMFMSAGRFGCSVTDGGLIIIRRFRGGSFVYRKLDADSSDFWEMPEVEDRLERLPIATTEDYLAFANNTSSGLNEIVILDNQGNDLFRFRTMRVYPKIVFSPDGASLVISSELGVSVYHSMSGELIREDIHGNASGDPVVSSSSTYWACSFRSCLQDPDCEWSVIAGPLADRDPANVVLADYSKFWTKPKVLSVSDRGDVLCVLMFDAPSMPESIRRYVLVDSRGNPLWISEPMFPSTGTILPTCNAPGPYSSVLPMLADVSSNGDRIILFDYSCLRVIELITH